MVFERRQLWIIIFTGLVFALIGLFNIAGSYDWMWYIGIMLAIGAALIHVPIHEAPKARVVATA